MKFAFLLLPFLLFPQWALAASNDCESADLRAQVGPIRNQGVNGWCYGFTAADMLTQRLRAEFPEPLKNLQVSAMDVTFQYFITPLPEPAAPSLFSYWEQRIYARDLADRETKKQHDKLRPYFDVHSSGFIKQALQTYDIHKEGVCWESDLPLPHGMPPELIKEVDGRYAELAARHKPETLNSDALTRLRNQSWAQIVQKHCVRQTVPTHLTVTTFDGLITQQEKVIDGTYLFYFAEKNADTGLRPEATHWVRSSLLAAIDKGLKQGRIVGIDYDPRFLRIKVPNEIIDPDELHSSSIVARQKVEKQCQFLIRNSWGTDCTQYNDKFKTRCSQGEIWVGSEELAPYLLRAHFLN